MIIDYKMTINELIQQIENGKKHFYRIDVEEGSLNGYNLMGITFEECILTIDFSNSNLQNAKFINSNIKTCTFCNADLTNALIEGCSVENIDIKGAKLDGLIFNNNFCYGAVLNQSDLGVLL